MHAFKQWDTVFPNAACAVALIDRLTHHAEIIAIEGESYRKREAEQSQKRKQEQKPKRGSYRHRSSSVSVQIYAVLHERRQPGDCRQQMQKQDGQIAHRTSYQDRDTGEECSRILEFAMHTWCSAKNCSEIVQCRRESQYRKPQGFLAAGAAGFTDVLCQASRRETLR